MCKMIISLGFFHLFLILTFWAVSKRRGEGVRLKGQKKQNKQTNKKKNNNYIRHTPSQEENSISS